MTRTEHDPDDVRMSAFLATSLDGFIARADGSVEWLEAYRDSAAPTSSPPPDDDFGFATFLADVDVLVMGRTTFDQVLTFDVWPYGDLPVVVLTHRPLELPLERRGTPSTVAGTAHEVRAGLARLGARHAYVDGGTTVRQFLAAGLLTDLTITVVPVLLGEGRRLFGPLPRDLPLRLRDVRHRAGLVQLRYGVG